MHGKYGLSFPQSFQLDRVDHSKYLSRIGLEQSVYVRTTYMTAVLLKFREIKFREIICSGIERREFGNVGIRAQNL
jgi:hypothetical protein